MKKNSIISDNEIDLVELIKTIWDGKIKIVLITVILVAINYGYNQQLPKPKPQENLYKNLLTIKKADRSEFYKFLPLYDYLNSFEQELFDSDQINISILKQTEFLTINNKQILKDFVRELLDFEELVYVLGNNKSVIEKVSNLTDEEKTKKIYDYAKLLTVEKPSDTLLERELDDYIISFVWKDPDEAKEILDQTIKLAVINLKKTIFNGLEDLLKLKKAKMINNDMVRIEFLKEQSILAKELGLKNNQINNIVSSSSQYNLSLNIDNNKTYYLRGYIAIDKEINIIKERNHARLLNLQNRLQLLKKSDIEWLKYNTYLLDAQLISKPNIKIGKQTIPLYLSILFGLIIGIFYVFISNAFQSQKITKK